MLPNKHIMFTRSTLLCTSTSMKTPVYLCLSNVISDDSVSASSVATSTNHLALEISAETMAWLRPASGDCKDFTGLHVLVNESEQYYIYKVDPTTHNPKSVSLRGSFGNSDFLFEPADLINVAT